MASGSGHENENCQKTKNAFFRVHQCGSSARNSTSSQTKNTVFVLFQLASRFNRSLTFTMQSRDRGWMVLALFFCSGATALIYEVVWSKFLSQMFGSTVYAQTVVMAVFMGGLALG